MNQCTKCTKECDYKNKMVCDYCKHEDLPLEGICEKCINDSCRFTPKKNI